MKIVWRYSSEIEAQRIIHTCSTLAHGFYQKAKIYVLPYKQKASPYTAYLPNLNYQQIPGFWPEMRKTKYNIPMSASPKSTKAILERLPQNQFLSLQEVKNIKNKWQKKQTGFLNFLKTIFPKNYKEVKKITIYPTAFGTHGGYSNISNNQISLSFRRDAEIFVIARMIILSFIHSTKFFDHSIKEPEMIKNKSWFLKQNILSFLINHTGLTQIFPRLKFTDKKTTSVKLLKESQKYLEKLGFPSQPILALKNNKIYNQQGKKFIKNLSRSQEKVLKLLIKNKGKIVSFDQIAQVLWRKKIDKKYSFYAITKLISNIRKKVRSNEIFTELIHTQRGQGYAFSS